MQIVHDKITILELAQIAEKMFGGLVKAVVDVDKKIMVIDAEMHADLELYLLESFSSKQESLWGINLYPAYAKQSHWIEFDSMINLRPSFGNRSRGVDDPNIQKIIIELVNSVVSL